RRALEQARRLDAAWARAREGLDSGALDDARAAVNELLELNPDNADAAACRQRIEAALAERRVAEETARAQQAIGEARRQFAAGDSAAAIALLEKHQPPHWDVTAALESLRAKLADIEAEQRRKDAEQRQREEERLRAEAERRKREQEQIEAKRRQDEE